MVRLRPLSEETVRELLCALPAKVQMQVRGQGYSLRWDGELSSWTPKPTRRPETVLLWSEGHRGLERLVCVRPGRRLGRISLGDGMTARVFSTEVEHHTGLARPYLSGRWYDLPERQSLRIEVCGAVKDSNLRRALGDARALELLDEAEKLLLETR